MGKINLSRDIAIDLGSSCVKVHVEDKGVVLCEPSVVAIDKNTDKIVSVGLEASRLQGRSSEDIITVRPLEDGRITKYEETMRMLEYFVRRACGKTLLPPRVMIVVPSAITEVEERAIMDAAAEAGARKTFLVQEAIAAAIGTGVNITTPVGNMVVNIGGGVTEIAVISLGGIVVSKTVRVGGDHFDAALVQYIRENYGVLIGDRGAEELKKSIGCVFDHREPRIEQIKGRDINSGMPRLVGVSSKNYLEAVSRPITAIFDAICEVIEKVPPELVGDILHNGICYVGGGSMIAGIDRLTEKVLRIKARVADAPNECVVRGAAKKFEDYNTVADGCFKTAKKKKHSEDTEEG